MRCDVNDDRIKISIFTCHIRHVAIIPVASLVNICSMSDNNNNNCGNGNGCGCDGGGSDSTRASGRKWVENPLPIKHLREEKKNPTFQEILSPYRGSSGEIMLNFQWVLVLNFIASDQKNNNNNNKIAAYTHAVDLYIFRYYIFFISLIFFSVCRLFVCHLPPHCLFSKWSLVAGYVLYASIDFLAKSFFFSAK